MGPATPAIETRNLTREFNGSAAVNNLNLTVARGEMFGLAGPDGAGKSTAIRLLCGLLRPSSGDGRVLGFDIKTETEQIKARIGYLSQNFTLYGDLTIDENIEFFADIHGVGNFESRRNSLLDLTGLTSFRKRLAQNLSGGMKKKLALACTLIHQPELIFLDEPSTGVDPVSRGEFWNILTSMVHEGMTVVLTTPYMDEAERFDRIALMHRGRLMMVSSPQGIMAKMPGKVFSVMCPQPAAAYGALRAKWPADNLVLLADRIHMWSPTDEKQAIEAVDLLNRKNLGPARFETAAASLEDAFVGLIASVSDEGGKK